jgi:hypothetical protein
MKTLIIILVAIFVLWLPFSLASISSVFIAFWAVFSDQNYAKDILRTQDKLMSALFGWGGEYTVSAECGSRRRNCVFCKSICKILNFIQPGHCEGAAKNEGLI